MQHEEHTRFKSITGANTLESRRTHNDLAPHLTTRVAAWSNEEIAVHTVKAVPPRFHTFAFTPSPGSLSHSVRLIVCKINVI